MEDYSPTDLVKIWQQLLFDVKKQTTESYYTAFLQETQLLSLSSDLAEISVKNAFIKTQIVARFDKILKSAFEKQNFFISEIIYNANNKKHAPKKSISVSQLAQTKSTFSPIKSPPTKTNLNSRYSFDNFVNGFNTKEAFAACQAIAAKPGRQNLNPFFIYSGVGLGKTHLIQATGNAIIANFPNLQVLYITAEDFYHEFIEAIRSGSDFNDRFRKCDCLIVDDIQSFTGKDRSQDAFFNTFNALYQNNKQIILSSDRPPGSIKTLTDRLKSRFSAGFTIDIQMPDMETRAAIIRSKTEESNISFSDELVNYIAQNCHTNIRELEGILNNLCTTYELCGTEPTVELARSLIQGTRIATSNNQLSPKQVIDKIAHIFQISASDILSTSRTKHIAEIRQLVMYIMYVDLGLSYPKIGHEFGKDHTTVLHSVRKIKKSLATNDAHIKEQVELINRRLYA
ncbi:MAG: chromosomal replication initiator protein DnaA [Candidatus Nomurabacteria bacterium]|jgi:chromosomal replication initiator protein|nr:chromosomal replication initiator protein DnaA [Candidatus Nomurabacteria bacterium]